MMLAPGETFFPVGVPVAVGTTVSPLHPFAAVPAVERHASLASATPSPSKSDEVLAVLLVGSTAAATPFSARGPALPRKPPRPAVPGSGAVPRRAKDALPPLTKIPA